MIVYCIVDTELESLEAGTLPHTTRRLRKDCINDFVTQGEYKNWKHAGYCGYICKKFLLGAVVKVKKNK